MSPADPSPAPAAAAAPRPRGALRRFFAETVPVDWEALKHLTNEPVPNHLRAWFWALGGTPAIFFGIQLLTGILLAFYYVPSPDGAYESVRHITHEVPFGWWVRSVHKWSGQAMILALCLHVFRVFFTGAYRHPRQLNWVVGVALLTTTLVFGFTGYSLVYEQMSYWGATVASNITSAVPVVGPIMANLIRGGEQIGPATLTRFFILHIGVLPTVLIALLALHIAFVRMHGVTEFQFRGDETSAPQEKKTFPFFPDHVLTELIVFCLVFFGLSLMAVFFPAEMADRADPNTTPAHIKPEWYFFFTFRWLKLTSLEVGVLGTTACLVVMAAWPWIDALFRRRSKDSEISVVFGILAIGVWCGMTIWEAIQ